MPSDPDNEPAARKTAPGGRAGEDPRHERLARALRDNLKKRKAQQRQRRAAAGPAVPDDGADHSPGDS